MLRINLLAATVLAAGLLFGSQSAQAHCDSIDGPVAKAAVSALDAGNVDLALPYAPAKAEAEIKAAFAQSLKVRGLGPEAKALADRAFIETTVRLHRAGEGAAYTGLKPAGIDYGAVIPAAELAVTSGQVSKLQGLLAKELEHGLHAKFAQVRAAQEHAREAKGNVAAQRERISAELGFVTYTEGLRLAVEGAPGHEHKE